MTKPELSIALKRHTPARVGLTRTGSSLATSDHLAFQLDHALARDAVHTRLDRPALLEALDRLGFAAIPLESAIPPGPNERHTYLRRPDLGRNLSEPSAQVLTALPAAQPDIVFVIADGLSALAVERHALAVLDATTSLLKPQQTLIGPVCVVTQARVAIGDEVGALLQARAVVVLIGERPGLSSADSLGVYITWNPRIGRTDAERICISNIRHEGLSYADAAQRIVAKLATARELGATGVALPQPPSLPASVS